jgi:hypothetical protein
MLNSAHWVSPTKSADESDLEWLFCLASAFQASERRSKMGIHAREEISVSLRQAICADTETVRSTRPARSNPR